MDRKGEVQEDLDAIFEALQRTSPKTEEGQKFKDGLLNILEKMKQIEDTRPDPD